MTAVTRDPFGRDAAHPRDHPQPRRHDRRVDRVDRARRRRRRRHVARGPRRRRASRSPSSPAPLAEAGRRGARLAGRRRRSPSATPVSRREAPRRRAPPASAGGTLTVAAVGDMLFGRSTAKLISRKGGAAPLASVAPLLASADIAVGNLEGAISTAGAEAKWKDVHAPGRPARDLGLRLAGFDLLALANNHIVRLRLAGRRATPSARSTPRASAHAGAGADARPRGSPSSSRGAATTVAFLAFTRVLPTGFGAGRSHPGVASAYEEDERRCRRSATPSALRPRHRLVPLGRRVQGPAERGADRARRTTRSTRAPTSSSATTRTSSRGSRCTAASSSPTRSATSSSSTTRAKTGEAFILDAEVGPHGVGERHASRRSTSTSTGTPSVVQRRGGAAHPRPAEGAVGRARDARCAIEGDRARVVRRATRSVASFADALACATRCALGAACHPCVASPRLALAFANVAALAAPQAARRSKPASPRRRCSCRAPTSRCAPCRSPRRCSRRTAACSLHLPVKPKEITVIAFHQAGSRPAALHDALARRDREVLGAGATRPRRPRPSRRARTSPPEIAAAEEQSATPEVYGGQVLRLWRTRPQRRPGHRRRRRREAGIAGLRARDRHGRRRAPLPALRRSTTTTRSTSCPNGWDDVDVLHAPRRRTRR